LGTSNLVQKLGTPKAKRSKEELCHWGGGEHRGGLIGGIGSNTERGNHRENAKKKGGRHSEGGSKKGGALYPLEA